MNIEQKRKEFDEFLISKNYDMTDKEVVEKAIKLENEIRWNTDVK